MMDIMEATMDSPFGTPKEVIHATCPCLSCQEKRRGMGINGGGTTSGDVILPNGLSMSGYQYTPESTAAYLKGLDSILASNGSSSRALPSELGNHEPMGWKYNPTTGYQRVDDKPTEITRKDIDAITNYYDMDKPLNIVPPPVTGAVPLGEIDMSKPIRITRGEPVILNDKWVMNLKNIEEKAEESYQKIKDAQYEELRGVAIPPSMESYFDPHLLSKPRPHMFNMIRNMFKPNQTKEYIMCEDNSKYTRKDAYVCIWTEDGDTKMRVPTKTDIGESERRSYSGCGDDRNIEYLYDYRDVEKYIRMNLAGKYSNVMICKAVELVEIKIHPAR